MKIVKSLFFLLLSLTITGFGLYAQSNKATETLRTELERFAGTFVIESSVYPPLDLQLIKKCINDGANVNTTNSDGETVLHLLMAKKNIESVVQFLIDNKADLNKRTVRGEMTALHIAAIYGQTNIISTLLKNGANPNIKDDDKETPLHFAVERKCLACVKVLVEAGANVNAGNSIDVTPLHSAVEIESLEIAEYLLEKGANVNAKRSYGGYTPLRMAINKKNKEMQELLKKYGGKKK